MNEVKADPTRPAKPTFAMRAFTLVTRGGRIRETGGLRPSSPSVLGDRMCLLCDQRPARASSPRPPHPRYSPHTHLATEQFMTHALSDDALDRIFCAARSLTKLTNRAVDDSALRLPHELYKWGPTSMNCQSGRIMFVRSAEAKQKHRGPRAWPGFRASIPQPSTRHSSLTAFGRPTSSSTWAEATRRAIIRADYVCHSPT